MKPIKPDELFPASEQKMVFATPVYIANIQFDRAFAEVLARLFCGPHVQYYRFRLPLNHEEVRHARRTVGNHPSVFFQDAYGPFRLVGKLIGFDKNDRSDNTLHPPTQVLDCVELVGEEAFHDTVE